MLKRSKMHELVTGLTILTILLVYSLYMEPTKVSIQEQVQVQAQVAEVVESKPVEPVESKPVEPVPVVVEPKRVDELPSRGSERSYKLRVQITAYTAFEPGQTSGTGLAYDGRPAIGYHTMAVDPRVIPLGSKVYVPGLGWFLAHDTGNAIKGNIVDVCLHTSNEANNWGRRNLDVIVIPPTEKYKMAW